MGVPNILREGTSSLTDRCSSGVDGQEALSKPASPEESARTFFLVSIGDDGGVLGWSLQSEEEEERPNS